MALGGGQRLRTGTQMAGIVPFFPAHLTGNSCTVLQVMMSGPLTASFSPLRFLPGQTHRGAEKHNKIDWNEGKVQSEVCQCDCNRARCPLSPNPCSLGRTRGAARPRGFTAGAWNRVGARPDGMLYSRGNGWEISPPYRRRGSRAPAAPGQTAKRASCRVASSLPPRKRLKK